MTIKEKQSEFDVFAETPKQSDTTYTLPFDSSVWAGTELPEHTQAQVANNTPGQVAEPTAHALPFAAAANFPLLIFPGGSDGINGAISSSTSFDVRTHGSGSAHIDNLIAHDFTPAGDFEPSTKWGSGLGQGADLTYSLSSPYSVFTGRDSNYGQLLALTSEQQVAIRAVMAEFSDVTGLTFTEVNDTQNSAGDIRWTRTDNPQIATASGYYPGSSTDAGDIWIGNQYPQFANPVIGGHGYQTLLHELGHALGLSHPHQTAINPAPGEDQLKYSVMSYRDFDGDPINGYTTDYYPTTLMINDIAALQFLYGANTSYRAGDDVYTWASDKSVFETIYDAGGIDTIDARSQSSGVLLNLNPGQWSEIGQAFFNGQSMVRDNLTIAYGTVIENVIGSNHNDTLIGNDAANSLNGWYGADQMIGGNGDDTYYVDNTGDVIIEEVGGGHDRVLTSVSFDLHGSHIEDAELSGTTVNSGLTGNELNNVLIGDSRGNILRGHEGDDHLIGNGGNDILIGGVGNDSYNPFNLTTTVSEKYNEGTDWILFYASDPSLPNYFLPDNVENLSSANHIDNIFGNELNNELYITSAIGVYGQDGNDLIRGGDLNDYLDGGRGADVLYGGRGSNTLIGGEGADIFGFDSSLGDSQSYIQDFNIHEDTIQLSHLIFDRLEAGALHSDYFVSGNGLTGGLDANDFLVLDSGNGNLYYDADGSGSAAAILFAQLAPTGNVWSDLSYQQFSVV